jgi:hypothetical protein
MTKSTVAVIENKKKTQKNKTNTGTSSKVKSKSLPKSKVTSELKATTKVTSKRMMKKPKKKVTKPPSSSSKNVKKEMKKTVTAKSKAIISEPVAASVSTKLQTHDNKQIERSTSFSTLEEATLTEMPYALTLEEDDEWNENKLESKSKSKVVDNVRVVDLPAILMSRADPPATFLFEADPPVSPCYDMLKE